MSDNGLCLKHDAEIENIKQEIKEIKEENRIQNKEFREVFSTFSDIKEAIVTSSMTLQRLNEKMDAQEQSTKEMSNKFEKTTKELSDKVDHLDKKVEAKQKSKFWSKFENSATEYLIKVALMLFGLGVVYAIMNIDKFMK